MGNCLLRLVVNWQILKSNLGLPPFLEIWSFLGRNLSNFYVAQPNIIVTLPSSSMAKSRSLAANTSISEDSFLTSPAEPEGKGKEKSK